MELNALHTVEPDRPLARFAVLGSGPLPLTSVCIADALQHGKCGPTCIHNVDQDPLAIAQSRKLCCALGHTEETMCFHCADAQADTLDLYAFDVVYLAALAGTCNEEKHEIIASVVKRMRAEALLVLRTAHSLRGLLYPVGPREMASNLLRILAKASIGNQGIGRYVFIWINTSSGCASVQSYYQFGHYLPCRADIAAQNKAGVLSEQAP